MIARAPLRIAAVVAALIVVCSYSASLSAGFIWDDLALIVEDEQVHSLAELPAVFARDFFSPGEQRPGYGYYRPIITISYMFEYALVGPIPWLYHATNIAFHLGVTLLVFALCRRLTGGAFWGPLVACALFASHPIHSESVTWISGRTDVMCTAFGLASLLVAMSYLDRAASAAGARSLVLASTVLFAISLFAKEMALVLPLVVASFAALRGERPPGRVLSKSLPLFTGYAAVVLIYLVMRVGVADVGVATPAAGHSIVGALLTFPKALAIYVSKLVLPIDLEAYMVVPYETGLPSAKSLAGLALLSGGAWGVARWWRSRPSAAFLLLAFFSSFVPLMNLVAIKAPSEMGFTMAERFLYLPSAFFCMGIGLSIASTLEHRRGHRAMLLATLVVVVAFAVRTQARALDYRSNVVFFAKAYAQQPQALLLASAYGSHLRRAGEVDQAIAVMEVAALRASARGSRLRRAGEVDQAIAVLERALVEIPSAETSSHLTNNLAIAYATRGRFDEAVRLLKAAERLYPELPNLSRHLGGVYWLKGDHRTASRYLDAALEKDPGGDEMRTMRVVSRIALGDLAGARADLDALRERGLGDADLYLKLGSAYRAVGKPREAIGALQVATKLGGGRDIQTLMLLGTLLGQTGDLAGALLHLGIAHRQAPKEIDPAGAYATALVLSGRRDQAMELMREVVEAHPQSARALLIVANLELASGRREAVRHWLERARVLAPESPEVKALAAHLAAGAVPSSPATTH